MVDLFLCSSPGWCLTGFHQLRVKTTSCCGRRLLESSVLVESAQQTAASRLIRQEAGGGAEGGRCLKKVLQALTPIMSQARDVLQNPPLPTPVPLSSQGRGRCEPERRGENSSNKDRKSEKVGGNEGGGRRTSLSGRETCSVRDEQKPLLLPAVCSREHDNATQL